MNDKGGLTHPGIRAWVDEVAAMTRPERILVCDGSEAEKDDLITESLATRELIALNQAAMPGCYLHRSANHDVARTEHLTFVCTAQKDDSGPNNNWMAPADAVARLTPLFTGAMKGRTMYVVPFLMGPPGSRPGMMALAARPTNVPKPTHSKSSLAACSARAIRLPSTICTTPATCR